MPPPPAPLPGALKWLGRADHRSSSASYITRILMLLVDLVMIVLAAVLAVTGRLRLPWFTDANDVATFAVGVSVLAAVLWVAMNFLLGAYQANAHGAGTYEYQRLFLSSAATASLVGVGCYLAKYQLSRGYFVLFFGLGIFLLLWGRYILRRLLARLHRQGHLCLRVLIAGQPQHIDEVAKSLRRESWLGYQISGALVRPGWVGGEPETVDVVGDTGDVLGAVNRVGADLVVFAEGSFETSRELRRASWDLEKHNTEMVVVPALTDVSSERITVRPVGGLPLVHVQHPPLEESVRVLKWTFDMLAALVSFILAIPLLVVAAVAIRLHDGGPVLFRQERVGKDGVPFSCYKLRTMVTNAENLKDELELTRDVGQDNSVLYKQAADPRITKPGRWIRRFSIDELPQLLNVLRGEMALVGPRPALASEVAQYTEDVQRRLRVRPGMTGLWQVSGRSELSWEETVRLDLYYVDNWSLLQDLSILSRTARAVIGGRGAY